MMLQVVAVILLLVHRHAVLVPAMGWVNPTCDLDATAHLGEDGGEEGRSVRVGITGACIIPSALRTNKNARCVAQHPHAPVVTFIAHGIVVPIPLCLDHKVRMAIVCLVERG